jgi:triosephosphate isomerase (TIM)
MDRLIVANWKQNPATLADSLTLAAGVAGLSAPGGVSVVVAPPLPYLGSVGRENPLLVLGAQDVSVLPPGPHTGEVGAEILKDLGVRYVIVGHSERRALGEMDGNVAAKAQAAVSAGLVPIVCVGEPRGVREQGMDAVKMFLATQLAAVPDGADTVVAYEPIWAIGSGNADDPASAADIARWIAGLLEGRVRSVRVLYGGSATPENASAFLADPAIGGLLVGGASLDAGKFAAIVNAS